jgi:hypothetical protein
LKREGTLRTEDCQLKRTAASGTIRIMIDPATKLRQLRLARGFKTAAEAANYYGWNVNTYKSHENGARTISKKAAGKYGKAYNVLPGWLLYDSGPKSHAVGEVYKGNIVDAREAVPQLPAPDFGLAYRRIPRLSWEIMANITNVHQAIAEATDFYLVPVDDPLPALSFALKINDDSMLATDSRAGDSFRRGDDVVFSPQKAVSPGDFVLARIFARNETIFRQYRESGYDKHGRKIVSLHALNANWADEDISLETTGEIVARLIRHSRDYS